MKKLKKLLQRIFLQYYDKIDDDNYIFYDRRVMNFVLWRKCKKYYINGSEKERFDSTLEVSGYIGSLCTTAIIFIHIPWYYGFGIPLFHMIIFDPIQHFFIKSLTNKHPIN